MLRLLRILLSSLPLLALPVMAAVDGGTGVMRTGPALAIFAIAAALIMTLVLRSWAGHLFSYCADRLARRRIERALEKRSKHVLHGFILPGAYGGLAKIDHAMMTTGGLLCIRAMRCTGTVFGDAGEPQWSNVTDGRRRRFLNPVIQNEGRVRALSQVVPDVPVQNLVIFPDGVEFTAPPPPNVIRLAELDSYIAKFVFGPSKIGDWDEAWLNVTSAALDDEASHKDFSAQVGFS